MIILKMTLAAAIAATVLAAAAQAETTTPAATGCQSSFETEIGANGKPVETIVIACPRDTVLVAQNAKLVPAAQRR